MLVTESWEGASSPMGQNLEKEEFGRRFYSLGKPRSGEDQKRVDLLIEALHQYDTRDNSSGGHSGRGSSGFLLCDLYLRTVLRAIGRVARTQPSLLILWPLEHYELSAKAFRQEVRFQARNSFSAGPILVSILGSAKRWIVASLIGLMGRAFDVRIIYPSYGRQRLAPLPLRRLRSYVLRNWPISPLVSAAKDQGSTRGYTELSKSLLVAGSVGDYAELERLAELLSASKYTINVAGRPEEKLLEICRRYPNTVIPLGELSREEVTRATAECLACLVLYDHRTENQALSASGKLLEAMSYGKWVVVNRNPGVAEILEEIPYLRALKAGSLTVGALDQMVPGKSHVEFDSLMSFEHRLDRLLTKMNWE